MGNGWQELVNKVLQIFKRDLRRLLHNPVAIVITIGVCIIPSLYAWYNIAANWDPYGNTAGVRIAVANEDAGVENEYVGSLNAGAQTVEELKQNHDLGWVFTDAADAREGVERGDYYAAIVIPSDFSENLTSMLTGSFEQPELKYYVNEKKNAIAPKVTDTGAETIEQQINETFVSTVSKTLVEKADGLSAEMDADAAAADAGLTSNVDASVAAIQRVRDSLSGMDDTIELTKQAIASADATLAGLAEQTPSLADALTQGDALLASTRDTARTFGASLSATLAGGMTHVASASAKADGVVGTVTGAVSAAQAKIDLMLTDVQGLLDRNAAILEKLEALNEAGLNSGDITVVINGLTEQNKQLQGVKDALQAQSDAIKADMDALAGASGAINDAVQGGVETLGTAQQHVSDQVMPGLTSGLDAFSRVSGDLGGVVAGLEPTITQARGTLGQLTAILDQAKTANKSVDKALENIQSSLTTAATDLEAWRSSEAFGALRDMADSDAEQVAGFMAAPVTLETQPVYPVANYGSGVAPFYTNLALWVGGFVLIAIFKLEVDPEGVGAFTATQGYFGRWLLLVALGAIQALIVCVGDLALGVQCGEPALFVAAGVFISFVYVNIIYALAIAFKHIGKAIAVVLVIVQIPGSSGLYPIEMMPGFFQGLHPLLPFTYGIAAMRETVGGMYGATYAVNLGVLALYVLAAFVIGVLLRPALLNLNLLFDRHLSRTGVMICEHNDLPRERYSLRLAMRAILDVDAFRAHLVRRAERFERRYPKLIKIGFGLVFGVPVLLFLLCSALDVSIDGKIALLTLWIVGVIAADAYMIVVEYVRDSLNVQLAAAQLPREELRRELAARFGVETGAGGVLGAEDAMGAPDASVAAGAHMAARGDARDAEAAPETHDAASDAREQKGGEAQ